MDDKVAPCMLDASRKVKKVYVNGTKVGIAKLDFIIEQVSGMKLEEEEEIKRKLLKLIKAYNYVPSSAEGDYVDAVFETYKSSLMKDK